MPNILVSVADAVTTALNTAAEGTFSQEFQAERSYADWDDALDDADSDKLKVDVVAVGSLETEIDDRGSLVYSTEIDVIFRQRLGPEKRQANGKFLKEELDALVLLVQEAHEFFSIDRLADFEDAEWDAGRGTKILASPRKKHLREHHQFTGHIRIPFTVNKTV